MRIVPSLTTLRLRFPELARPEALALRKVLDGRVLPESIDPRLAPTPGRPKRFDYERTLAAADIILETHGVEWMGYGCTMWENAPQGFYYLNAGDTYNATLVYLPEKDVVRVACWGDMVEAHEKRCATCRKAARL